VQPSLPIGLSSIPGRRYRSAVTWTTRPNAESSLTFMETNKHIVEAHDRGFRAI
jgi:hypothetical protein